MVRKSRKPRKWEAHESEDPANSSRSLQDERPSTNQSRQCEQVEEGEGGVQEGEGGVQEGEGEVQEGEGKGKGQEEANFDFKLELADSLNSNSLFGREEEIEQISQFLCSHRRVMYICGTPGTGKTLCVTKTLPEGAYIYRNCMRTAQSYLIQSLNQESSSIIIIDEFDLVESKRELLLKLREAHSTSKIILICNENKKDVELSRFHEEITTLFFMPYSSQEMRELARKKMQKAYRHVPEEVFVRGTKMALRKSGDFREFQNYMLKWAETSLAKSDLVKPKDKVNEFLGQRQKSLLQDFILNNSLMLNKLLFSLITFNKRKNSLVKRGCICNTLNLSKVEKVGELKEHLSEVQFYLGEWKDLGLVEMKSQNCRIHRNRVERIILKFNEEEGENCLNEYFYRHED